MRGHAGNATPEQGHIAGQAQCQVDVGAAAGDTPGTVDLRCRIATNAGMGDVGGTAADVDDHRLVALGADRVVVHGGRGGFFQKVHLVKARRHRRAAQDVQRLVVAGRADRAAELHRAAKQGAAHVVLQLARGGQADVFEDVGGDAGDGLPGARVQVVAQHRLGALHQVAFVFLEVGFQCIVAVHRVLQQGGGAAWFADAFFHPLPAHHADGVAAQLLMAAAVAGGAGVAAAGVDQVLDLLLQSRGQLEIIGVAHHLGEVHRGAELLCVAKADRDDLAVDMGGGGRVAGAEVDAEFHGACVSCCSIGRALYYAAARAASRVPGRWLLQ